jgi:sensor histidine kinase YesM
VEQQIDIQHNKYLGDIWLDPKFRILRHFVALLVVGTVVFSAFSPFMEPYATYAKLCIFSFLLFVFYTNMYVMVPKFLFCNRYRMYILGMLFYLSLSFTVATFISIKLSPYRALPYVNKPEGFKVFIFIFIIMMIVAASTAIKLFQRWLRDTERINELEKVTMQSELEQLKNQINPHFLFNMLNNANVLTQKDPEKASQVLMKLSDLLRYQLYDSTRPKVLLTADIHFLEDFLNLEKIRRDNFECIVDKQGDISGVQVAPLLFIIFVENAVKYSMDTEKKTYIHLHFDVRNDILNFECINSKSPGIVIKSDSGGLGHTNVKRRLELLYPGRYALNIQDKKDHFSVTLKIKL